MYSYKTVYRYGKFFCWIYDPHGVVICPIESEGHAVVLVDHLNRAK